MQARRVAALWQKGERDPQFAVFSNGLVFHTYNLGDGEWKLNNTSLQRRTEEPIESVIARCEENLVGVNGYTRVE